MRVLLDTCTFLWAIDDVSRLSEIARQTITEPLNEVFLSAISAWEIAIKQKRGRLKLSEPAIRYVPRFRQAHGFLEMPVDETSVLQVGHLPDSHRDPFDRMLICQAIAHGLAIVTPDPLINQYPVRCIW